MNRPDNLNLSQYSENPDYDLFFEDDDIQDFELDGELNQLPGKTHLDETDDYFWDEN